MSLLSRLREKQVGKIATATPATFATQAGTMGRTVASAATVTVANHRKAIPEPISAAPAKIGSDDTATASRSWLIHYPARDPVEVACSEMAHGEILERCSDAIAAEPFVHVVRQPSAPMTANEETAIRTWLALIGESDSATISEVIEQCQRDAVTRDYFTERAATERPKFSCSS